MESLKQNLVKPTLVITLTILQRTQKRCTVACTMFGRKSREIAAQRIEIAHLREERTAVLPHLEVAKSLAEKANELADPNNNLTDEQRASLHLQALQGGF